MHPNDFDRLAIRDVIARQLDAFQRADGEGALALATSARQRHGSGQHFLQVVREVFPTLVYATNADFGDLLAYQGQWAQEVTVTGENGSSSKALYVMQRQADGQWRIDGCVMLKRPEAAARSP